MSSDAIRVASSRRRTLLLLLLVASVAAAASATTWTISSTTDSVAIDGVCSLREAIRAAATDGAVNECVAGGASDEIVLAVEGPYSFDQGEETLSGTAVDPKLSVRGQLDEVTLGKVALGKANVAYDYERALSTLGLRLFTGAGQLRVRSHHDAASIRPLPSVMLT